MNTSTKTLLAAALMAVAYGCAQFTGVATLRGSDATTADQVPADKQYAGKRPGSGQPIARSFDGQPPLIPHAVDNFDEITISENQCLECHGPATAAAKKAPPVDSKHLAGKDLRMDRYQCNSCHVPQVNAPPLVGSTFAGTPPQPRKAN